MTDANHCRQHSSIVVDGPDRAPSRAMLRAVGFGDADFQKPVVGIASTWTHGDPVQHAHRPPGQAKPPRARTPRGGKAVIFGTITVSDGISMGTQGMRYSLVSREIIADSIETVVGAEGFDGLVAIGGCDKNMPGCVMAMARLNRPRVFVYGGTILPGRHRGQGRCDIVTVFEAVGQHAAGTIDDAELRATIEEHAIPGAGSCGGMYTANTMACGHRGDGHEPAEQRPRSPPTREDKLDGLRDARRRPCSTPAQAATSRPRDIIDHGGLRERHRGRHRPRRLDERRAAPHRHRPTPPA
jgi:dihydroxy-acid dehydratase